VLRRSTSEYNFLLVEDLIPLPALEPINVVSVNHDGSNFIVVDFFHRSSSPLRKRLLGVAEDQVDLPCDGLSRKRVITLRIVSKARESLASETHR
jgi:hypothetical protein